MLCGCCLYVLCCRLLSLVVAVVAVVTLAAVYWQSCICALVIAMVSCVPGGAAKNAKTKLCFPVFSFLN